MTKRLFAFIAAALVSAAVIASSPSIVQKLTGKCPLCVAKTVCEYLR